MWGGEDMCIHEWMERSLARLWGMLSAVTTCECRLWLGFKCQLWCHCYHELRLLWADLRYDQDMDTLKVKISTFIMSRTLCTWSQRSSWKENFHCQSGHPMQLPLLTIALTFLDAVYMKFLVICQNLTFSIWKKVEERWANIFSKH